MKLEWDTVTLQLRDPFKTARTTSDPTRRTVHVRVAGGVGEAAPQAYYGETVETVHVALEAFASALSDLPDDAPIERAVHVMRQTFAGHHSARGAVEAALWDALGRRVGSPLWSLWGVDPANMAPTSFTIGLDTLQRMQEKTRAASDYAVLKVKLGSADDLDIIRALRDATDQPIRVDANTGWEPKEAVALCHELADFGVELVEQPVAAEDLEGLRFVRERSPLPIFADESCRTVEDVRRLEGRVDGVNIKLTKCGGPLEARTMIRLARIFGMKVMVGCMIESSVGIATMAQVAPLADHVDLDGNLLISNDTHDPLPLVGGRLALSDRPGNGLIPRM